VTTIRRWFNAACEFIGAIAVQWSAELDRQDELFESARDRYARMRWP